MYRYVIPIRDVTLLQRDFRKVRGCSQTVLFFYFVVFCCFFNANCIEIESETFGVKYVFLLRN